MQANGIGNERSEILIRSELAFLGTRIRLGIKRLAIFQELFCM